MSRKVLLFAVAGVLLIIVVFLQLKPGQGPAAATPTVVPVVVAKNDIPPYSILKAEDVRSVALPGGQAANTFGGLREVVGLMTTAEIRSGNIIQRSDVLVPDANFGSGDMLVFSFYVQTSRVLGGQLRPGHHVDLLVTRPENRDEPAQSLWLARNLWVVGVQQASGEDVTRPTVTIYSAQPTPAKKDAASALTDFGGAARTTGRQGAANLVVVATHREIAKMVGDYVGAKLYDPWVYIRPEQPAIADATPAPSGAIDGVVYTDLEDGSVGVRDRGEPGLDGLTVTLYDASNAVKARATTASGGAFAFSGLAAGNYTVESKAPEGYTAVTPERLAVYVADGQYLHLLFAEKRPEQGAATPKPVQTVVPQPATVAPPRATAVAGKTVGVSLKISATKDGPDKPSFEEHTREVWAMAAFQDGPSGMPYTVALRTGATGNEERLVSSGTWAGGTGTESVKIVPEKGTEFAPGTYVVALRAGAPESAKTDFKLFTVAGPGVAKVATTSPGWSNTGSGSEGRR